MQDRTLVLIPTYNEYLNIGVILRQIFDLYPCISVCVIDGCSNDGTQNIVRNLALSNKNLYLYEQSSKDGLGRAYICGLKFGLQNQFQYFIQMDSDLSHNPIYIADMLYHLHTYDMVIGSRNVEGGGVYGWGLMRKIISGVGSLYARLMLGVAIRDFTGGFNAYSRSAIEKIGIDKISSNGYCFQIEIKYLVAKRGLKFIEFPIIFEDRVLGNSKMNRHIIFEAMWRTIWMRIRS